MRLVIPCVILSAAVLSAQEPTTRSWDVDGVKREAIVYAPAKGTSPPPLVFAFHGHGGTAQNAAKRWAFHEHWPEAVTVYPQGLPTPGKLTDPEGKRTGWQHGVGDQKDRDLKFFDAMLASLTKDHGTDPKRVYATGHSNGGGFTYTLWAGRGDAFAAVAPSGSAALWASGKLKPKPVLHLAGEKDPLVKYAWQEKTIAAVKKLNGVEGEGKPAGKHCTEYGSKGGPAVVTFLHPGGHEFPAGGAARIVEFFKGQTGK
ncbi:MAG: alpha/beta hydrolase family esterase [Gemmataceae bacterium]